MIPRRRYEDDPHAVLTLIFVALVMASMLAARGCRLSGRRSHHGGSNGIRPPCPCRVNQYGSVI